MSILNRGLIIIFVLTLILPLVFVDLATDRISVQENRRLADLPKLADLKRQPGKFKGDFDRWFKDSTGFREQILALYNILNKNKWLNGVRYTNGQYINLIGEEGHHYFAHVNGRLISIFQGGQYLSDKQLQAMASKFEEVKTYLDTKGIPLVVMFCADKESIYPEFYPKSIRRGPEPIQLDVITDYLQNYTSVDVFNIRQALLAEKNNYPMYPVSSGDLTHYTQIAAFFAYRELMKHINVYLPQIVPYTLNDVEISYNQIGTPNVTLMKEKTYQRAHTDYFDSFGLDEVTRAFNIAFENTDPDLPAILLLRDSFAEEGFFIKYVAQHFSKTIMIHYVNLKYLKDIVNSFNPDIVILESIEYNIEMLADSVNEIPELLE